MKRIFLFAALVVVALTSVVQAATFHNRDSQAYTLVVKQDNQTFQVVIDSLGTIRDLCEYCTVEVVGYSLFEVESEPALYIKNGILSVKK